MHNLLGDRPRIVIASDGSSIDGVSASAVAIESPEHTFAGGDSLEDQGPYRAEVQGILLALRACLSAARRGARGTVVLAVDCTSAIDAAHDHCKKLPLLGSAARSLLLQLRSLGVHAHFSWVPSHGKHGTWQPDDPTLDAFQLRTLNEAADRAAKASVLRRLRGSLKEQWALKAKQVEQWELGAICLSAKAAEALHLHLKHQGLRPGEEPNQEDDA